MASGKLLEDYAEIARNHGVDPAQVADQIEMFRQGARPVRLIKPARIGDGITRVPDGEEELLFSFHERAAREGRMLAFVPASGAASRMFEYWHQCLQQGGFESTERSVAFIKDIFKFGFFSDLKAVMSRAGQDIEECLRDAKCAEVLEYVLTPKGLNYAWLPKALLKFHVYPGCTRTATEEHLAEVASYLRDGRNTCRVHFTVSGEHESRFRELLASVKGRCEEVHGMSLDAMVSTQLRSTDTVAVDMENRPFRDKNGKILFRPGGHGALLQNLNAIDGDIIFVKNIDNIVPDRLKEMTVRYKKVLGGFLVRLQDEIFEYLRVLSGKRVDDALLSRAASFCEREISVCLPEGFKDTPARDRREWILQRLDRPIRVCGMVRNDGEPGGGPFWVEGEGGTRSLQIIEQNQVDMSSEEQKGIWKSSTHFNPVDLVCGVRSFRGEKFDLNLYADRKAVSISRKSHEGVPVKALELPGLWNGGMAFWNSVFVEVPIETFNPVKTVEDLLRQAHQPGEKDA